MISLKMFLITSSFKLSGEISCLFTASIWQATICCLLLLIFLKTKAVSVLALKIQRFSYGLLPPCIVSTPVNRGRWCGGGGGKSISTILWEGVFEDLFGGGSWWEGGSILEGRSGILEIIIIIFTSRILFDLLFTCRLKDVASLVIFHLRF